MFVIKCANAGYPLWRCYDAITLWTTDPTYALKYDSYESAESEVDALRARLNGHPEYNVDTDFDIQSVDEAHDTYNDYLDRCEAGRVVPDEPMVTVGALRRFLSNFADDTPLAAYSGSVDCLVAFDIEGLLDRDDYLDFAGVLVRTEN